MTNLYYNLSRCYVIVDKHLGLTKESFINKAVKAGIPEMRHWKHKDYFEKMVADGVIYEREKDQFYPTIGQGDL